MEFAQVNDLLEPGYLPMETGWTTLDKGIKHVAALTRMPRCRARMVHWWFSWMKTTEHYKWWHPRDHLFSDWVDRVDGNYIGASHLVHEYLGGPGPVYKLRINFQDPKTFLDRVGYEKTGAVAICAKIGDLEQPVNFGRMIHFVRDTDFGCEMRSRFWLGYIESRDPAKEFSDTDAATMRNELVSDELAWRLERHAVEEMGYLSEFLPVLYSRMTLDSSF